MKKRKYMGKIIGILFFAIYVVIAINLLVLYNYGSEKMISNDNNIFNNMNGCPAKPETLYLKPFYYKMQNEKMISNLVYNDEGYSTKFISSKNINIINYNG